MEDLLLTQRLKVTLRIRPSLMRRLVMANVAFIIMLSCIIMVYLFSNNHYQVLNLIFITESYLLHFIVFYYNYLIFLAGHITGENFFGEFVVGKVGFADGFIVNNEGAILKFDGNFKSYVPIENFGRFEIDGTSASSYLYSTFTNNGNYFIYIKIFIHTFFSSFF